MRATADITTLQPQQRTLPPQQLITRELTLQRAKYRALAASQLDLLNEISRLRQENAELEKLACIDNLTGVFNHYMMMQELERSVKLFARHNTSAVLLLLDLNNFKQLNDKFGHAAGNHALVTTAKHLASQIRATDCVARMGGDEFVLILNNIATIDAIAIADKLHKTAPTLTLSNASVQLSYAIGHATLTAETSCANTWLQAADTSMYRTKYFARHKN